MIARTSVVGDVAAVAAGGQRIGDAQRRLHAEIGADQHVLEILQRLLVQLALGEDAGDVAGQFARRAGQPVAQPLEPGLARRRLGRGARGAAFCSTLLATVTLPQRWHRAAACGGRRSDPAPRRLTLHGDRFAIVRT